MRSVCTITGWKISGDVYQRRSPRRSCLREFFGVTERLDCALLLRGLGDGWNGLQYGRMRNRWIRELRATQGVIGVESVELVSNTANGLVES